MPASCAGSVFSLHFWDIFIVSFNKLKWAATTLDCWFTRRSEKANSGPQDDVANIARVSKRYAYVRTYIGTYVLAAVIVHCCVIFCLAQTFLMLAYMYYTFWNWWHRLIRYCRTYIVHTSTWLLYVRSYMYNKKEANYFKWKRKNTTINKVQWRQLDINPFRTGTSCVFLQWSYWCHFLYLRDMDAYCLLVAPDNNS